MKKRNLWRWVSLMGAMLLLVASVMACGQESTENTETLSTGGTEASQVETQEIPTESAVDPEESKEEIKSDFQVTTKVLNGFEISGTTYSFKKGGSYTLSGKLYGQISVDVSGEEDTVELILAGASIEATENAPIYVKNAGKVKLIVSDGSYNEIVDKRQERATGDDDTEDDTAPEQGNAAIYARTDLTLNGTGSLVVTGNYNNGIHSTKDLTYSAATTKVTCVNNAFKGNGSVTVKSGNLTLISTKGDGIKTKKSTKNSNLVQKGIVTVEGGTIDVYSACDGIDASYYAVVNGGTLNIYTAKYSDSAEDVETGSDFYIIVPSSMYSDEYEYYAYYYNTGETGTFVKSSFETMVSSGWNSYYGMKLTAKSTQNVSFYVFKKGATPSEEDYVGTTGGQVINSSMNGFVFSNLSGTALDGDWCTLTSGDSSGKQTTEYSCKGIKAASGIQINGGTITIHALDDGLHANNDVLLENNEYGDGLVEINGGSLFIVSGDDGIHGDAQVTINDGTVEVSEAYEGIEAVLVTINGGTIHLYASDDGINAFGGSSQGGMGGFGGRGGSQSTTKTSTTTPCVTVNGGYVEVETGSGDTDAIDSNGNFKQTGGYVLVKGGSSSGTVSGSVDVDGTITVTGGAIAALGGVCETPENSCNAYVAKGTTFSAGKYVLTGSDGTTVMTFEITGSFSNGWFCSELLKVGTTYTLTKDGTTLLTWTQTSGTMNATSGGGFGPGGGGGQGGGPGRK